MSFVPVESVGILESPEDVLTTLHRDGSRRWMYPTESRGQLWKRRRLLGWGLIVFFVSLPIVHIGGRPAVLLDVAVREFTLFGLTFYPTDTFLLLLFGLSVLLSVVLLTALLGRAWCGWACPQTVYLEFVFRPIERLIEGAENARARRDAAPLSFDRAWRKAAKWALYLVIAFGLAHTFTAYFVGWERLIHWMTGPPAEHWGYFVLAGLTTGLVAFDFGVFREQMCTIACPYARFQSVLMDPDSLIVSYDPNRGEPRGKGKERGALGDCVDCFACVRTCPTGIDIRDGLQMECVACTQCVDACDAIMLKTGQPPGLIRYTSENALAGEPTRALRPRTAIYGLLLVALVTALTLGITTRHAYDVNVGRTVAAPFTELPDGTVANRVHFRVRNQTARPATFTIEALAPVGASVRVAGLSTVSVASQEMVRIETFVVIPRASFGGAGEIPGRFRLAFSDGTVVEETFALLGPSR